MELLKDISILWSLIHTLVMFLFLFESRYSNKKTIFLTLLTMSPLIIFNFILFVIGGFEKYGPLMLATLSFPSFIVFWFLSKHRDGRFYFTFCMIDTIVLEIIYITNIINHYVTPDSYLFLFIVRMLIYPLIEILIYKKLRPMYLNVQKHVTKGWGSFAIIGVSFYLAITLLMTYPTPIVERSEYIPVLFILFILMPVIYIHIISTLLKQQDMYELSKQETILQMQVSSLKLRMEEFAEADERFRVERHNFRHQLKTISSLIKKEQYDDCVQLLSEYVDPLDDHRARNYCQHTILDAMLSSYITKAQKKQIRVEMGFAFPDVIPVNETELATAIANAFENAINACEAVAPHERFIEIKVIHQPRFMLRIVNSYKGDIHFDEDGIPISEDHDHGFGTRFIAAFCSKYHGYYHFNADGKQFICTMNF